MVTDPERERHEQQRDVQRRRAASRTAGAGRSRAPTPSGCPTTAPASLALDGGLAADHVQHVPGPATSSSTTFVTSAGITAFQRYRQKSSTSSTPGIQLEVDRDRERERRPPRRARQLHHEPHGEQREEQRVQVDVAALDLVHEAVRGEQPEAGDDADLRGGDAPADEAEGAPRARPPSRNASPVAARLGAPAERPGALRAARSAPSRRARGRPGRTTWIA